MLMNCATSRSTLKMMKSLAMKIKLDNFVMVFVHSFLSTIFIDICYFYAAGGGLLILRETFGW